MTSFIGIGNHYRKFIRNFAQLASPLDKLTRTETEFTWNGEAETAFAQLKEALCQDVLLIKYDDDKPLRLTTDASLFALGAFLEQLTEEEEDVPGGWRPIEYFSQCLNHAETNFSATKREMLAIIRAIEKFQHFLCRKKFTIRTDHRALTWILESEISMQE